MPFRWVPSGVVIGSFFLCCGLHAQEQAVPPDRTIRVDVNRVNVDVTVTDRKGNFVERLQRSEFQVTDNGVGQTITDFAPMVTPAQVLLLLEAGPAVYLLQDSHLFVADALLSGLSPEDSVAIAAYNDTPVPLLNFTQEKEAADAALDQVQFNLGYGNLNLASSMLTVLNWLVPIPGKKNLVLISTGVDTSPPLAMQQLVNRLETGGVRVFAISMSGPLRDGKKGTKKQIQQTEQAFAQADSWLRELAESTGGRAYFPENARAVQETYRQIAELVRHEYSLAFAPPVADGAVHAIGVRVIPAKGNDKYEAGPFQVDHRRAYIAPKPQP